MKKTFLVLALVLLFSGVAAAQVQPVPIMQAKSESFSVYTNQTANDTYAPITARYDTTGFASISIIATTSGAGCVNSGGPSILLMKAAGQQATGTINDYFSLFGHAFVQYEAGPLPNPMYFWLFVPATCTVNVSALFNPIAMLSRVEGVISSGTADTDPHPVVIGGIDPTTTKVHSVIVNSAGNLVCAAPTSTSANQVQGAAANGAVISGGAAINPVLMSGYNSNAGTNTSLSTSANGSVGIAGYNSTSSDWDDITSTSGALDVRPSSASSSVQTEVLVLVIPNDAGTYSVGTAVPASPLTSRRAVRVQNLGPNPIYCTPNAQVDGGAAQAPGVGTADRIDANGGTEYWECGTGCFLRCVVATADQVTGAATIVTELK